MTGAQNKATQLCGLPPENRGGAKGRGKNQGIPGRADEIKSEKDDSESQGILETVGFS